MKKLIFLLSISAFAQSPPNNSLNTYGGWVQGVTATLAQQVGLTDTTIIVQNNSCTSYGIPIACNTAFWSNQVISIDNENMMVCSVNIGIGQTTVLTLGQSACPNIDGRAFGGTSAAIHFSRINSFFTSYSYNQILSKLSSLGNVVQTFNTRTGNVVLLKADVTTVDQALGVTDTPTFLKMILSGGTATSTNGDLNIIDNGTIPGITLSTLGGRQATWNASTVNSFNVVNSSGTSDFSVAQNGGPQFPHIPTGTSGGTSACFDGSGNLSSGSCGGGGGGGVIGPVIDESTMTGSDCGAKINTAYATLPSTGGQIIVPTACSFTTPIVFGTSGKPILLSGFGNGTTLTYTGTSGVAITFNNGIVFDFLSSIQNLTLTGPGNSTSTTGLLLGGTNGAVGFSASQFKFQSFGTVVQTASHTWITKFDHGMIRDGAVLFLEPSGQTEAGENVELDHVTFADAPSPHTNAVWIQGGGQETIFNTCSFDQAQLRIGNGSTSSAQVVVTNSHFENPDYLTGTDYPYVQVDGNNGNYLRFTDNYMLQDRPSGGAYLRFMMLNGGVVNINGVGLFSPVQITQFAFLANAVNINLFGYNDLSGQTVALFGGTTTGFVNSFPGANTAATTGFNTIIGAGDPVGPAPYTIIQDTAIGTTAHNHNLIVNGNEQINTGSLTIASGGLVIGGATVIDSSRNVFGNVGDFGPIVGTTGSFTGNVSMLNLIINGVWGFGSAGGVNANSYFVGGVTGLSCPSGFGAGVQSTNGIITHC